MEMTNHLGSGDSDQCYNHILNTLQKSLEQGNTVELLSLIDNSSYVRELQAHLDQLMPIITNQLNGDVKQYAPEKFKCAKTIFTNMVEKLDCEDVLLQLIEDIQNAVDDVCCLCLVEEIWKAMVKLPKKRINSFGWGLDAISMYIRNIEADDEEHRITNILSELVHFCNISHQIQNQEQKYLLLRFWTQLLGKPFACLSMQSNTEVKRTGHAIVEKIIQFHFDILSIPELSNWGKAKDLNTIDSLSLATLYYTVFSEKICWDKIPQIYDQIYVFQTMLPFISELLSHSEHEEIISKGLNLLEASLDCVRGIELPHSLLDIRHHNPLCQNLCGTIIFSLSEVQRKFALKLFHRYLLQFETYGRYLLMYNVRLHLKHSGLTGFVVTVCKDMINEELNAHSNKKPLCFSGFRLSALLYKFCRLPQGDPIEMADEIVSTLNLLRFLAIRDRNNRTGVQEYLKKCKNSYFEGLKKILISSRLYYESMIKQVNEAPSQSEVSVEVAGQVLKDLTSDDKLSALNSALTTIDVIESLLGRLNEVFENT